MRLVEPTFFFCFLLAEKRMMPSRSTQYNVHVVSEEDQRMIKFAFMRNTMNGTPLPPEVCLILGSAPRVTDIWLDETVSWPIVKQGMIQS